MDIHKPKPIHNGREFWKEVGIIVLGVCIALAAEQTVEAMHHRAQAREMTDKLLAESRVNIDVIDYDMPLAEAAITALEAAMKGASADVTQPLQLPFVVGVIGPSDAAWSAVQYSALLPIMPESMIDNYWKIQRTNVNVNTRGLTLVADYRKAMAAVEVYNRSNEKAGLRQELLLRLADAKQSAITYLRTARSFKTANKLALAGKEINLDMIRAVAASEKAK